MAVDCQNREDSNNVFVFLEEMTERLKVADCKSVRCFLTWVRIPLSSQIDLGLTRFELVTLPL